VEEEVHPEDVDPDIVGVRPQRSRPQVHERQVGLESIFKSFLPPSRQSKLVFLCH
jgi:hypothetical protein